MSNDRFPLAEVLGQPTLDESNSKEEVDNMAEALSKGRCPFINRDCKKLKKSRNAVCATYTKESGEPMITCPNRFEQNALIFRDSIEFIFGKNKPKPNVKIADETEIDITLKNENKCDFVIFDKKSKSFGLLEVQSVYNSNSTNNPYKLYKRLLEENRLEYLKKENEKLDSYDPNPDILSSIKRIVFQMIAKGKIFKEWGMKQVYVTQKRFYDHLGLDVRDIGKPKQYRNKKSLKRDCGNETPLSGEDIKSVEKPEVAWFLYDIKKDGNSFRLTREKSIYTTHDKLIEDIRTSFHPQYRPDKFYKKVVDSYSGRCEERHFNDAEWRS